MSETLTCRLCLSTEGVMFPIFHDQLTYGVTTFRTKILSCADVEIYADDGLPTTICHNCFHQVERAYQFRNQCEKTEVLLRSQLTASTSGALFEWKQQSSTLAETLSNWDIETCELNLICMICSLKFETHNDFIFHFKTVHPNLRIFSCKTCSYCYLNVANLRKHVHLSHNESTYSCSVCDSVFLDEKNLDTHKVTHDTKQVRCGFCNENFFSIADQKKHEETHLEKLCGFCSKEFATVIDYQTHMQTCKQVYSCTFCDKSFKVKKDLLVHVNEKHDSTEAQKCGQCHQVFLKWTDFNNHTCSQNVECLVCKQHFPDEASLKTHQMSHSNEFLKCKFCSKKFSLKSSLRRHEKSHSGLKPYQCKYCPKRFKDNGTCTVHIRTHTGEHPYECPDCHKHFKQLANLKMHTFRHHKKKNKHKAVVDEDFLSQDSNNSLRLSEFDPQQTDDPNQMYSDSFNLQTSINMCLM